MSCCLLLLAVGCRDAPPEALHDASTCRPLAKVVGPEDFAVDESKPGGPRLLVSSQDRRNPTQEGAIYSVHPDGRAHRLPLKGRGDCSFHPHGISLVGNKLYVINHHEARDGSTDRACYPGPIPTGDQATSVEVFEVHRWELRFLQRLADPEVLPNGNDLVADEEGNVYVAVPPGGFGTVLEKMGLAKKSRVVEYRCLSKSEGKDEVCEGQWGEVLTTSGFVNGIALVQEGDEAGLVFSTSLDGGIKTVHRRDGEWKTDPKSDLEFGVGHDNLLWLNSVRRTLLVASHPDLRALVQHARSARVPSPSVVWKVSLGDEGDEGEGQRVFYDDGTTLSGASTAGCFDGKLILGQIFGEEVLQCDLPDVCGDASSDKGEEAR